MAAGELIVRLGLLLLAPGALVHAAVVDPPPILYITKLRVKPGRLPDLVQVESERVETLRKARWPRTMISSVSISGAQELWIFARYQSLGELAADLESIERMPELRTAIERLDRAEAGSIESKHSVTATYQPAISYRPRFDWDEVRYWEIIWVRLRTGHHEAYLENRRMTREEHEKGAYDTHQMMYAVQSGELSGTFLVIRPMKELSLLDDLHAHNDGEPETPQEERKKVALFGESALSEEEAFFRVVPAMSYTPVK